MTAILLVPTRQHGRAPPTVTSRKTSGILEVLWLAAETAPVTGIDKADDCSILDPGNSLNNGQIPHLSARNAPGIFRRDLSPFHALPTAMERTCPMTILYRISAELQLDRGPGSQRDPFQPPQPGSLDQVLLPVCSQNSLYTIQTQQHLQRTSSMLLHNHRSSIIPHPRCQAPI